MARYTSREAALEFLSTESRFQRDKGISFILFGFSTSIRNPVTMKTPAKTP
jgi:hypothetical protein